MARAGRSRGHADHRMERRDRRLHRADRGRRTAVRDLRRAGDGDERSYLLTDGEPPHLRGPHRRRDRERLRGRRRARVPRPGGAQRPRALQEERVRQRRPHGPVRHRERGHRRDHVLVTDRNGDASTASSWNRHSRDTNRNDALLGHEGPIGARRNGPEGRHRFSLGEVGSRRRSTTRWRPCRTAPTP